MFCLSFTNLFLLFFLFFPSVLSLYPPLFPFFLSQIMMSSKVKQVQRQVEDVKVLAFDNIKKQLNNIDDLGNVQENASHLGSQAAMFDTASNQLKWYERRRNLVVTIALAASGFLLLAIVIAILVYIFN